MNTPAALAPQLRKPVCIRQRKSIAQKAMQAFIDAVGSHSSDQQRSAAAHRYQPTNQPPTQPTQQEYKSLHRDRLSANGYERYLLIPQIQYNTTEISTEICTWVHSIGAHGFVSSSGLPSSRKMKSYWRESSGGLRG